MNTKALSNKKVWSQKPTKKDAERVRKAGRIHAFVFNPNRPELVGFLIKRPDIAWMFRRDDLFVAHDGFVIIDDDIIIKDDPQASGKGAIKTISKREVERCGKKIGLDDCVIWFGLPVITQNGQSIGYADSVEFDEETGQVLELELTQGATANTLLGRRKVPASMIKGFRRGIGARLNDSVGYGDELLMAKSDGSDDGQSGLAQQTCQADQSVQPDKSNHSSHPTQPNPDFGAILVDDAAADLPVQGGAAEVAGQASAVAADKAKKTYRKVVKKVAPNAAAANAGMADVAKEAAGTAATAAKKASGKVYETVDKASEATAMAVDKAGDAAEKGAYAAGRQVARAAGMFSGFAAAFKEAMDDEDDHDDSDD